MIVIGSTQLTYTADKGSFHCPNCDRTEQYRLRKKREFLTVYFIPLVPLRVVRQFVLCDACHETFDPGVQDMTVGEIRATRHKRTAELIRRVMVMIVGADQQVTDAELAAVADFCREQGLPDVSRKQLLGETAAEWHVTTDWVEYVRSISRQMAESDKELLVEQAFLAASAAGDLSGPRQRLLSQLPAAVGIDEGRFREIIAYAADRV